MRLIKFFFDSVFVTRPILHYPIWIFAVAGVWGARHLNGPAEVLPVMSMMCLLFALSCMMGAVYILNQLQDIETDRMNGKVFLISNGTMNVKQGYLESLVLVILGLFIGYQMHWQLSLLLLLLLAVAGYLYNYPPFAFKNRSGWDVLGNGLGGWIVYIIGWKAAGGAEWLPLPSLAYFFAGMSVTLNTMLPDMEGDAKTGKISFAVRYGVSATAWTSLIFVLITTGLAFYFRDSLLKWASLAVVPFFVWSVFRPTVQKSVQVTKIAVSVLALSVVAAFPWFLIPVFITFSGTKWYYWWRFRFVYPRLRAEAVHNTE